MVEMLPWLSLIESRAPSTDLWFMLANPTVVYLSLTAYVKKIKPISFSFFFGIEKLLLLS